MKLQKHQKSFMGGWRGNFGSARTYHNLNFGSARTYLDLSFGSAGHILTLILAQPGHNLDFGSPRTYPNWNLDSAGHNLNFGSARTYLNLNFGSPRTNPNCNFGSARTYPTLYMLKITWFKVIWFMMALTGTQPNHTSRNTFITSGKNHYDSNIMKKK